MLNGTTTLLRVLIQIEVQKQESCAMPDTAGSNLSREHKKNLKRDYV